MKLRKRNILGILLWIVLIGTSVLWYNRYQYQQDQKTKQVKLETTTQIQKAYFAWGCFWCVESGFEKYKQDWVIEVISWYSWGESENPSYEEVWGGWTGHREAVEVLYDPSMIAYGDLVQIFWRLINPTDDEWQYVDRGFMYTTAIWYQNETEKQIAENTKQELQQSGRYTDPVITPILPYTNFFKAEEYHQDYYIKSPIRYNAYTNWSGRKSYLDEIWWEDLKYTVQKS